MVSAQDAAESSPDAAPGDGARHRGPGHRGEHRGEALEAAAAAIGIDEDALREALRDGPTLAEVAEANGVDPQVVVDALVAEANERLDEAVAEGRLSEERATELRAELAERITERVQEGRPERGGPGQGRGPGGMGGHGPRDGEGPGAGEGPMGEGRMGGGGSGGDGTATEES
jgi:hypothetical protein